MNLTKEQKQKIKQIILRRYLPAGLSNTAFGMLEEITGEKTSLEDRYKYVSLNDVKISDNIEKNKIEIQRFRELKNWVERNEELIDRGIVLNMKKPGFFYVL